MTKKTNPGTLSVCMIVKNEEPIVARCIESVREAADQIVVVDTGSSDSTAEVADKAGAEVYSFPWNDNFSDARNESLKRATGEWILWLDADDIVAPDSIPLLCKLKKQKPDRVLAFTVRNERPENTGTEFVQARMFPNRPDIFFERRIHEQMMPSAIRAGLTMESHPVVIEHHGYADPAALRAKAKRNVGLLLQEYQHLAGDPVITVEIADSYLLMEEYDDAVKWYKEVLKIPCCRESSPSIAGQALLGLGNILNKQEKFSEAIEYLKEASEISPWRTDTLFSLAVAQEMSGEIGESISTLRKICTSEARPGQVGVDFRAASIKAYLRLIRILTEQNRLDEAFAAIQDALLKHGDRPEIRNMAGKCYLKAGKLIDSLHEFEKSIKIIVEGNLEAYLGLCIIYRIAGVFERVGETLVAISPLFGDNPRFMVFSSFISGQTDSSVENYHTVLEDLRREFFYTF